jgi:EmrB/QacA subfamily drug resistance transporter
VAVVVIGSFMAVLDTSIVNVAIPSIENELGASADQGEWVVTGYSLMLGVVVPTSSWLGERYGLERVQNVALLLFITGSALCGLSTSISTLIGLRLFQAIGGGLLPAVSLTIVYRVVPRESFGTALGIYGFGVILAPAIGPVVGGFLVQYSSWRLIYFINVPVGIIGAVLSYRVVPHFERKRGQRFDLAGWVTIAVGLFSLLLALSEGQKWHWTSYRVLGLVAVGGLSLALFVVLELSAEAPLLNLRVFLNSNYRTSVMIIAVLSNGLFSAAFFIPLFLQQGDGLNAFQTGLTLVPAVFVTLVMVPLSGRLFDRFGARSLAAPGLLVLALAEYLETGQRTGERRHRDEQPRTAGLRGGGPRRARCAPVRIPGPTSGRSGRSASVGRPRSPPAAGGRGPRAGGSPVPRQRGPAARLRGRPGKRLSRHRRAHRRRRPALAAPSRPAAEAGLVDNASRRDRRLRPGPLRHPRAGRCR